MLTTTHDIKGKLTVLKYNKEGQLIEETVAHNSITKAGRQLVTTLFKLNIVKTEEEEKTDAIKRISIIHLGRSNKPFDVNQTAMQDYIGQTPITSVEDLDAGEGRRKLRLIGELDEKNCNGALQEAGLFTEDDTPVMYNRVIFDTITKSEDFKLTLIWELTF